METTTTDTAKGNKSTEENEGFEVLFRLYGPEKALFDKTWKLSGIEKINS
jgi:hypothetical protein